MYRTTVAALVLSSFVPATDYAVSASRGKDSNPGTVAQPFKTLTKAFGVAKSGDTVTVFSGRYGPTLGEKFPLNVAAGVKVLGVDARSCIIDAEFDPASTTNAVTGNVMRIHANCELSRMSIVNAPRNPSNPGKFWWNIALHVDDTGSNADNVHVHHCVFDEFTRGVVVGFASGDHKFKNVTIDNCVFTRFYAEAINSWVNKGAASGNRILNCTVVAHQNPTTNKSYARACITFGNNAQFDVRNCVLKGADWAGLEATAKAVTSDHNCYHGNGAAVRNGVLLGKSDIQVDPRLVALPTTTQTADVHQAGAGGPLFDKGTNIITTGSDMDYQSRRLIGLTVDIGADEFSGADAWFEGVPRLGKKIHIGMIGSPSSAVMLAVALASIPPVTLPGISGSFRIDLSAAGIILGLTTNARGTNRQQVTIPTNIALLGLRVYIQNLDVKTAALSDLDASSFVQ
jgi:Protein of unknown function (DUF1565)